MSMKKLDDITMRLSCLLEATGITQSEFAIRTGITKGYASQLFSGDQKKISRTLALLISKEFDVQTSWLVDGEGAMRKENPILSNRCSKDSPLPTLIPSKYVNRLASGDFAFVPLFDVRAAAGAGAVAESEEVVDLLVLNRIWIRQQLGADPSSLSFLYVDGDSMEPLLRPNEMILVDRSSAHAPVNGVYVIRLDGNLLVKRLLRCPGNIFIVKSENEAYRESDFTVTPEDGKDFAVIGRVVWAAKSL